MYLDSQREVRDSDDGDDCAPPGGSFVTGSLAESGVQALARAVSSGVVVDPRSGRFSRDYERLSRAYEGTALDVSFREIVGALPADEHTHGIYPYPARLLRHIPRFILATEQVMDGVTRVLDPFAGSGTVLLEAQLRGIESTGIDQNPIAALVSRVKTGSFDVAAVALAAEQLLDRARRSRSPLVPSVFLDRWYSPAALSALGRLTRQLSNVEDPNTRDLLALSLILAARRVSKTDGRIPVPVLTSRNESATARDVWAAWNAECEALCLKVRRRSGRGAKASVVLGSALDSVHWPSPQEGRSTVLVSSPPYGAAQKYVRSTSLDLGWLGYADYKGTINIERGSVGREHLSKADRMTPISDSWSPTLRQDLTRISGLNPYRGHIYARYFADMQQIFSNASASRLRRMVLVSGTNTVCGHPLATHEHLADLASAAGFSRTLSLRDPIRGRALMTARKNGTPAPAEYIDVFEGWH